MLAPSGIFGVVAGLVLLAAPASARTWAGDVNMQAACEEQYENSSVEAILKGSGANDWVCYNPNTGNSGGINVNLYCQFTYGRAYADPQGGGAYDWGCYHP